MSNQTPAVANEVFRRLPEIEEEIAELERQVVHLPEAGTDFALRLHRRSTSLISALDDIRSALSSRGTSIPQDFWSRTAAAVTALTSVRGAAGALLGR